MLIKDNNDHKSNEGLSCVQQYYFGKGLRVFGEEKGKAAALREVWQQHTRKYFAPIAVHLLTRQERAKTQEALMYLVQKRTGEIKGHMVYNSKPTRKWLTKENMASPMVATDSLFDTIKIAAKENQDIMRADVPNAFIQMSLDRKDGEERIVMMITGVLVDMLVEDSPDIYGPYVVYEKIGKFYIWKF